MAVRREISSLSLQHGMKNAQFLSHCRMPLYSTCVFSTKKPNHKVDEKISKSDEIGDFVKECKEAYDSEASREILQNAGKRAQLAETDSSTIVWRHTDLGANSDRETYTFHMSSK